MSSKELRNIASDLVSIKKVYDLYIKRDGKYGPPWNKEPLDKKEINNLLRDIERANIPSVDMSSVKIREASYI